AKKTNLRLRFAVTAMARTLSLSPGAARDAGRRLDELGVLRVLERSKTGHYVDVRPPEKIRAVRPGKNGSSVFSGEGTAGDQAVATLEATDFWKSWPLRKAIHARERGSCFYCLRRTLTNVRCLDQVVPRVRFGRNSYPHPSWHPQTADGCATLPAG